MTRPGGASAAQRYCAWRAAPSPNLTSSDQTKCRVTVYRRQQRLGMPRWRGGAAATAGLVFEDGGWVRRLVPDNPGSAPGTIATGASPRPLDATVAVTSPAVGCPIGAAGARTGRSSRVTPPARTARQALLFVVLRPCTLGSVTIRAARGGQGRMYVDHAATTPVRPTLARPSTTSQSPCRHMSCLSRGRTRTTSTRCARSSASRRRISA